MREIEAWVREVGFQSGIGAKVTIVIEAGDYGHTRVHVTRYGPLRKHEGDGRSTTDSGEPGTVADAWRKAEGSHAARVAEERRVARLRKSGLAKLTDAERLAMQIDGPDACGPWSRINGKAVP